MKQAIIIFIFQLLLWSLKAQSFQGFYTGQLKLSGSGVKMSVQMDMMEDSGRISAVLRFRAVDDNTISGCDNWLAAISNSTKLRFLNLVSLRETNIPSWVCNDFKRLDLELKKGSSPISPEFNGNLLDENGGLYGRITISKVDSINSFSIEDERAEAMYRISERQIAMAADDSTRIGLMLANRGIQVLDSLEINPGNASLKVEAPLADRFHKLTLLFNDNVVLLNASPAERGANIKMNELEEGNLDVILLCYHFLVETNFTVKLTLTHDGGEKVWEVPVTTFKNRAIRIKVGKKS
jgi:hypothetical protein